MRAAFVINLQLFAQGAGFENFPTVLQPAFQQNQLDRAFQDQLEAMCVIRQAAFVRPQPVRSGEIMIYSRAGQIQPVVEDFDPTLNVAPDNGLTGVGGVGAANPTYPVEQYALKIGMIGDALDLNLYQDEETIASFFKQNVTNLGRAAAYSLDLKCIVNLLRAYEGGRSWLLGNAVNVSGNIWDLHVDNYVGFDTAFQTATIRGAVLPYGLPQPVASQHLAVTLVTAASGAKHTGTVTQITSTDNPNVSSAVTPAAVYGVSGIVRVDFGSDTYAPLQYDILRAVDAAAVIRPGIARSRAELTASSTTTLQMFINAVKLMRNNNIPSPLPDGTFPCYIDHELEAQLFTDPAFQILTQGEEQSASFKNARVAKNFHLTFVPTTNLPTYTFTGSDGAVHTSKRAIVCGERFIQEGPFAGTEKVAAQQNGQGITDVRMVNRVAMVHRLPVDRFGQILSQGYFYIGGFCVPTDATMTPLFNPSATAARYKRAVVLEIAAS